MTEECEHNYELVTKSNTELCYKDEKDSFGVWTCYTPASIICKKCGHVKNIRVNEYKIRR